MTGRLRQSAVDLDAYGRRRRQLKQDIKDNTAKVKAAVLAAIAAGMPESEAARRGDVDRMTVRKWQGKRP